MKRKEPGLSGSMEQTQPRARRQAQISCRNCRLKKLKCDRGAPCASCLVRGISCTGQPGPKPIVPQHWAASTAVDASILARLESLERAVYGGTRHGPDVNPAPTQIMAVNTHSPIHRNIERQQTAKFADLTYLGDNHNTATRADRLHYHVASASSYHSQSVGGSATRKESLLRSTFIMTREEALLLLPDFIENPYHLLPIIHEPSARSMINKFYMQLEQGQEGDPASAALILSIASTSASFFSQNASTHDVFSSIEEAAQSSMAWRQTALAILNEPHFFGGSLEECQARAILAYVVYNTEGCSARFRFLHSCSVAAARDMSLHLIDSVVQADRSDDFLTKEIKRRLWWHLASTDWLLGQVGGPLDGTYVIQPRHFNVNRPRNLNDNDLTQYDETLTYPLNVPTQMSCFLQRIRLSEICRELMDAKALGSLDVEITDFNTVTLLDRLFEQTLTEMPPFLKKDARIPQNAPTHLAQQRDLILLCFHIRRARLHRPFLLHDTDEPRYEPSRHQCIASARTVLSLSTELLEGSSAVDQNQRFGNPLAYRAGLVISSIFLACTILALNAGLIWNSVAPSTGDARMSHSQPEIHAEIARACRALVKAGEKSAFAANLLHNLMGVLKQYRVKDIDDLVESRVPPTESNNNTKYVTRNSNGAWPTYSARDESNSVSDKIDLADNFSLWNDFFTTIPELEGYDQLFAGLDSLCGPA